MYNLTTWIAFLTFFAATTTQAALLKTKDPSAICNNGQQATFMVSKSKSSNWFIYFEGGGVAASPDSYRKRKKRHKQPASGKNYGLNYSIVKDFKKKKFNVVVIPYCTSDLHQGSHSHQIDGKKVYFHGRKIIEDVFKQLDSEFKSAGELIFAGYSAGAIGLGFNADLIKKYKNPKLIVDSFWLDKESRRVRKGWTKGPWPEINKFLYSSMPRHCKGHWSACFPQRTKFKSMKIKHVFPIWNIGDPYIKGDMNKVRKSIENDIQFYDAGFSIDAKKFRVEGFEKWGHVITADKHYTKKIDGVSVKMLIENWLSDQGQTTLVKH